MKNRIAMWATAGFLVAAGWGVYFASADKGSPIKSLVSTLARFSQPVAAVAASYLHTPISVYWFLTLNAATYALIGLIVETLRSKANHSLSGS